MDAYTGFAEVYDAFMDNIPYEHWADYVESLLKDYQISDGLVLELGCGTGSLTELLASKGYDMIGVDNSGDMLQIAMEKKMRSDRDILYLQQDMREFELYGTVRAVVSICDCVNYITEYQDLVQVLSLVNNYLDPEGILIFDLNTEYKYSRILGDNTIAECREDKSFIWDNRYDPINRINEYDLTLFMKEQGDLYRRYDETHYQKAYTLDEIRQAVKEAGMELIALYDAFTRQPVKEDSERIYVVARESGKERKESR